LIGSMIWYLLVRRRIVSPESGLGLVLAAFGAHCRISALVLLHCLEWARFPHYLAPHPLNRLGNLYDAVSYGGLAAYILGLAAIVFVAIADVRRRRRSTR